MILRELTDKQADELRREAERMLANRQKSRKTNPLNPIDYKIAFSDGVRAILALIDKLPEKR